MKKGRPGWNGMITFIGAQGAFKRHISDIDPKMVCWGQDALDYMDKWGISLADYINDAWEKRPN